MTEIQVKDREEIAHGWFFSRCEFAPGEVVRDNQSSQNMFATQNPHWALRFCGPHVCATRVAVWGDLVERPHKIVGSNFKLLWQLDEDKTKKVLRRHAAWFAWKAVNVAFWQRWDLPYWEISNLLRLTWNYANGRGSKEGLVEEAERAREQIVYNSVHASAIETVIAAALPRDTEAAAYAASEYASTCAEVAEEEGEDDRAAYRKALDEARADLEARLVAAAQKAGVYQPDSDPR